MKPRILSGVLFLYTCYTPTPAFHHILAGIDHFLVQELIKNRTFIIHPSLYTCIPRVPFYYIYQIVQLS